MDMLGGLTLRQRLTLTLGGVMAAVMVVTVAFAYVEVRYSARVAASQRMETVAHQLADLVEASAAQRAVVVDSVASRPVVRRVLGGQPLTSAEERVRLDEALASLRGPSDAGLPVQLWDSDRRLVHAIGDARGVQPTPEHEPGFDTIPRLGRLQAGDGSAFYWSAHPVGEGDPVGWVVQQRRIGNGDGAAAIQQLVGSDAVVSFLHLDDTLWVNLGGTVEAAPLRDPPMLETFAFQRAGMEHVGMVAPIEGTAWGIAVDAPMAAMSERPRTFLGRMGAVGLVLLLATLILGWILGRRLSGPIQELSAASDAVAAGDFGRRVHAERGDELGRLAHAFNAMAERVSTSLAELRNRAADLERANVEAEGARREAQEANRAKSDFLATMSHEVRTPINAVLGYTELLRLEVPGPLNETQTDYLTRIDRSSRLLIALVEDVLDFSRMESGEMRVDDGSGSAREAVENAVAVVQPTAESKDVTVRSVDVSPTLWFHGDAGRVQQVLLNLLSNAVKFTANGGQVDVTCRRDADGPGGAPSSAWDGPWLRLDVTDTGVGIAPEDMERIFEPFVQADSSYTRDYGGVGLGLSISRKLAELMGGAVTVESEPDEGSRFTLWLRLVEKGARRATDPGSTESAVR